MLLSVYAIKHFLQTYLKLPFTIEKGRCLNESSAHYTEIITLF